MNNKVDITVSISIEEFISAYIFRRSREEILDFILEIEEGVSDLDFTKQLIKELNRVVEDNE